MFLSVNGGNMSENSRTNEVLETGKKTNVYYVIDRHGKGWYCDGDVVSEDEFAGQSCVEEEEQQYDRGFGG